MQSLHRQTEAWAQGAYPCGIIRQLCVLLSGTCPWRVPRLPGPCGWEPARHAVHLQGFLAVKELAIGMVYFLSPYQDEDHNRGHSAQKARPTQCHGWHAAFQLHPELDAPLSQDQV